LKLAKAGYISIIAIANELGTLILLCELDSWLWKSYGTFPLWLLLIAGSLIIASEFSTPGKSCRMYLY
jgi:hypothetical protein